MANLRPLDAPQTSATSSTSMSTTNNNISGFYNINNITTSASGMLGSSDYHDPNLSDDEPIYDPVADDDYEPMPPIAQQVNLMRQKILKLNNSFG